MAVFDYRLDRSAALVSNAGERQATADVLTLAGEYGVDTAIFAMPNTRREQLANLVGLLTISKGLDDADADTRARCRPP